MLKLVHEIDTVGIESVLLSQHPLNEEKRLQRLTQVVIRSEKKPPLPQLCGIATSFGCQQIRKRCRFPNRQQYLPVLSVRPPKRRRIERQRVSPPSRLAIATFSAPRFASRPRRPS